MKKIAKNDVERHNIQRERETALDKIVVKDRLVPRLYVKQPSRHVEARFAKQSESSHKVTDNFEREERLERVKRLRLHKEANRSRFGNGEYMKVKGVPSMQHKLSTLKETRYFNHMNNTNYKYKLSDNNLNEINRMKQIAAVIKIQRGWRQKHKIQRD